MTTEALESERKKRFLPFAHANNGVRTSLDRVRLDDRRVDELVDRDFFRVELDEYSDWSNCRIELTYSFDAQKLKSALPENEREEPPIRLVVICRALDAFTRRRAFETSLRDRDLVETELEVSVDVRRDDVRGVVEILPFVVRESSGDHAQPGVATSGGARIADGKSVKVVVDRDRRSADKYLEVSFVEFSERDDLESWSSAIYSVEHEGELPVLWLNRDHPRVAAVMEQDGAPHGAKARLRDVFYDAVTPAVWKQLFFAAVDGLAEDGETTWEWQEAVLEKFLPELYPNADELARRRKVLEDVQDPSFAAEVVRELDRATQTEHDFGSHFTKAVDEAL